MNKNQKDRSIYYVIVFAVLLAFVIGYPFLIGKNPVAGIQNSVNTAIGAQTAVESARPVKMNFSDILAAADAKKISTATIRGNVAIGTLTDGTSYRATIEHDPALLSRIAASGASITIDDSRGWTDMLGTWVPILMGLVFIWWIFKGFKMGGAGGIGRAATAYNPTKITTGKTKTTFADVAGIDQEKQEVSEIVDFLKNPDKFKKLGARVPRGVLLSGEPGTGKTLLARAIAGEANVPFFAASGSDFSGIIVGLGVAKIKEIFEMAKRNAPCILFIDEIDAIGTQRGRSSFNDNDRENTLNQLLIEMDGFSNNSGIIIIGATNRPDMLDKALLRPGRFDRQVYIELPAMSGREEILNLYAKKMKFAADADMKAIARGTTGFSGADLENLLNEAALNAARAEHDEIKNSDLEEARDKTLMGPKKNKKMRDWDKKLTAYHEAGHAFVSVHYRDLVDPIHKATIIPRGRSLGVTQFMPVDDKVSLTIAEIRANMAVLMGGRAAEEVFLGADKITTGAEMDIAHATYLARRSITMDGLSDKIGPVAINQVDTFGMRHSLESASDKTAEIVDSEIRNWIDAARKDAIGILSKNRAKTQKLADELLKRETLTKDEIEEIVIGKPQPRKPEKADKKPAKKIAKKK